jgi:hypothetical protein
LLTADKDFGELIFRQRLLHAGVLLIRRAGIPRVRRLSLSPGLLPNIRKSSVAASPYYPRER